MIFETTASDSPHELKGIAAVYLNFPSQKSSLGNNGKGRG